MSNRSVESVLQSLNKIHSGESEKVAQDSTSAETPSTSDSDAKVATAKADLEGAMNYLFEGSNTKNASENAVQNANATQQLEKIANDMAQSDLQATIKEAHAFGAAVFDGFLARANTYAQNTKTASAVYDEDYAIKQAAVAGYQSTEEILGSLAHQEQMKVAHGTEEQGIVDALEKLAAVSEECFIRGQQHMHNLAQRLG